LESRGTATSHLIDLGHRRIAHIAYAPARYVGSLQRVKAYRRALAHPNIMFDAKLLAHGDFSMESGLSIDARRSFGSRQTVLYDAVERLRQISSSTNHPSDSVTIPR